MGSKPSTAASTAATMPTTSGVDVISVNATATESLSVRETTSTNGQFGVPHALVIIACIATAAILAPSGMSIRDVLFLIAGAAWHQRRSRRDGDDRRPRRQRSDRPFHERLLHLEELRWLPWDAPKSR